MSFQFYRSTSETVPPLSIPGLGLELVVNMPQAASGGALTVIETCNAPGFGPPLHRHRETEVFRVLEGRYLFEVDGKRFEAATGDLVSVPGGANEYCFWSVVTLKKHILDMLRHKPQQRR
jgi:hypothetical protein